MFHAKIFIGQIINPKSLNELEVFPHGFIAVSSVGKIIGFGDDYDQWDGKHRCEVKEVCHLLTHQFLMPGFVDCHIHAPQLPQIGLGLDMPLLEWLNAYTFPLEAEYKNWEFAQKVYSGVVEATIKCGTTLASYFATTAKESTIILAKEIIAQGQRAFVGKVCSDCNTPDFYIETFDESIKETKDFINSFNELQSDLVKPIITPRFAVSCSESLMRTLGQIAREHNLNIQSHISENLDEIKLIQKLYSRSYGQIYDDCGLLTSKTIMAHAVHLENEEVTLLRTRGTSIAHCPSSNNMLRSGICDVVRLLNNGIKVGLGTDIAGGNSVSVQDTLLRAMDSSRHIEFLKKHVIKGSRIGTSVEFVPENYTAINYKQALFLATLGGAQALCLDEITGNFSEGKDFDALLIDCCIYPLNSYLDFLKTKDLKSPKSKLLELLQKFLYVGDDRNIVKVFVAGKQIKK